MLTDNERLAQQLRLRVRNCCRGGAARTLHNTRSQQLPSLAAVSPGSMTVPPLLPPGWNEPWFSAMSASCLYSDFLTGMHCEQR